MLHAGIAFVQWYKVGFLPHRGNTLLVIEIWLKRTDLGNIRNHSMTQSFVRLAQGIALSASTALRFR